jgi:hypothetical protein
MLVDGQTTLRCAAGAAAHANARLSEAQRGAHASVRTSCCCESPAMQGVETSSFHGLTLDASPEPLRSWPHGSAEQRAGGAMLAAGSHSATSSSARVLRGGMLIVGRAAAAAQHSRSRSTGGRRSPDWAKDAECAAFGSALQPGLRCAAAELLASC